MKIVMVGYMDLTGPGVMHLYHFANELCRQDHDVLVLLNGDLDTIELMEQPPRFDLARVQFTETDLTPALVRRIKAFKPDLVHIWTPRNVPARVGLSIKYHTGAKLLIHYEDDEDYLYDFHEGDLLGDLAFFVNTLRDPNTWNWKHPVTSFLANHFTDAFTAICRPYVDRLQQQWGKRVLLLYPGVDLNRFHPETEPATLSPEINLAGREVVLYSGSLGPFHQFDLMLQAFAQVARRRPDAVLVHLGHNHIEKIVDAQVRHLGLEDQVHFLGAVPHREIHHYLTLADVLVQSGRPDTFNEFRLPAKLPEYLAMGKPVITFSAGIGRQLVDGTDVLKTSTGEPEELAKKIEQVLNDPILAEKLGCGARRRAEELFDWRRNTEKLIAAYEQVLDAKERSPSETRIRPTLGQEVFGAWWETRSSRQILVIVAHTGTVVPERTLALAQSLVSRGHQVSMAVPESVRPIQAGIEEDSVYTWSSESLNWLVWRVDPEILLFDHWSALTALDTFARRPTVLDLASGWSELTQAPGGVLRALAKTDFFLCLNADQRQDFVIWAEHFGLRIPIDDIATISNRTVEAAIDALDQFCRAPFVRKPPSLISAQSHKSFGTLIDEAIAHYQRGGMPTLFKETLGFVGRRLRN